MRLSFFSTYLLPLVFKNALAARGAVIFTPIVPPSYPLAVRNPYLSAWMPGSFVTHLPSATPQFWAGSNLTWSVIARVDGKTYTLFGVPQPTEKMQEASTISAQYTSTHSIFTLSAAGVNFTLDFLSPITPGDYVRQSLPFSYLTVSASGSGQSVQIYSDIDSTWNGPSQNISVSSFTHSTFPLNDGKEGSLFMWQAVTGNYKFAEIKDMATWGNPVYATRGTQNYSSGSGSLTAVRDEFAADGTLQTNDQAWTPDFVTGFTHDLGNVNQSTSVLFTVGYVRDDVLTYLGEPQKAFYRSKYDTVSDALTFFIDDYDNAASGAQCLDTKLSQLASGYGSNYADIVTLSLRQIHGAWDFVSVNGTTMMFQKEISSNGNTNTMDVIFPVFPALYVMAPEYIRLLLEPVVEYLASGRYPENFTIHDIGFHYPNATGHDNTTGVENMPIEESGNLLILAAVYQSATKNMLYSDKYKSLFDNYADYLVQNALYPALQLSTDDFAGELANQTNLAIKAAVALNSWGTITSNSKYTDYAKTLATTLYDQGLGTDANKTHFDAKYGNDTSWMTSFNLFPDVLLNLSTFSPAAIDMQSKFYPTKLETYGVPLDSRLQTGKTDWMIFSAATAMGGADKALGQKTADMFIDSVHKFVSNGLNTVPFSDWYDVTTGEYNDFRARPVAGGHFAVMALKGPSQLQAKCGA